MQVVGRARPRDPRRARRAPHGARWRRTARSPAAAQLSGYHLAFALGAGAVAVGLRVDAAGAAHAAAGTPRRTRATGRAAGAAAGLRRAPAAYTRSRERDRASSPRPAERRARPRASTRRSAGRSASARCSSAGIPTRSRTRRRWPRASGSPPAQGAQLVCLQELTLSPYFAVDAGPVAGGARARGGDPRRADDRVRAADGGGDGRVRARVAVRAGAEGDGRTRADTTPRSASRPTGRSSRARASCTSR